MVIVAILSLCLFVAVATSGLAWFARSETRRWPVTSALLLGREGSDAEVDLRFWALASGLSLTIAALIGLPALRELAAGTQIFVFLGGTPLAALLNAVLADLLARHPRWRARAQQSQQVANLRAQLARARDDVRLARERVSEARSAAVEALAEALEGYAEQIAQGEVEGLAERIEDVGAMARSCLIAEGRDAARLLGIRLDASPAEARAVYAALTEVYGKGELPGVDTSKRDELSAAFARLELRMTLDTDPSNENDTPGEHSTAGEQRVAA